MSLVQSHFSKKQQIHPETHHSQIRPNVYGCLNWDSYRFRQNQRLLTSAKHPLFSPLHNRKLLTQANIHLRFVPHFEYVPPPWQFQKEQTDKTWTQTKRCVAHFLFDLSNNSHTEWCHFEL